VKFIFFHLLGYVVTAIIYVLNIAGVAGVLTGIVSFTGLPYGVPYPGFGPVFGGLTALTAVLWIARLAWKLPRVEFAKKSYGGDYEPMVVVPELRKEVP
jgi:ABC-type glucose/galactose transport system permease subunit